MRLRGRLALERRTPLEDGDAVAIGERLRQHGRAGREALIVVAVDTDPRVRHGQPLVERGDPHQRVVRAELGVYLVGRDFGKEVPVGVAPEDARIVLGLVEIAVAGDALRRGVRLERARDHARLAGEQIADLGRDRVGHVPGAVDGLIEIQIPGETGARQGAVADVDVGEIGGVERHGGGRVLFEHRHRVGHLEPRRPVVGSKFHRGRPAQRSSELIAHTPEAGDGVGLERAQVLGQLHRIFRTALVGRAQAARGIDIRPRVVIGAPVEKVRSQGEVRLDFRCDHGRRKHQRDLAEGIAGGRGRRCRCRRAGRPRGAAAGGGDERRRGSHQAPHPEEAKFREGVERDHRAPLDPEQRPRIASKSRQNLEPGACIPGKLLQRRHEPHPPRLDALPRGVRAGGGPVVAADRGGALGKDDRARLSGQRAARRTPRARTGPESPRRPPDPRSAARTRRCPS